MADFQHETVMTKECLTALEPALTGASGIFVDATLGLGGHTKSVLECFPSVQVIAIDRDPEAIRRSKVRLAEHSSRIMFEQADFNQIEEVLSSHNIDAINAILFDLGVSSMQLDDESRGFSFHQDARLDMRMNPSDGLSAYEVVNSYDTGDLERIVFEYGEEKYAKRIVAAIIARRPITTTTELVDVIKSALPAYVLRKSGHPARKTFQAIRIEVNQELNQLSDALKSAVKHLSPNGRLLVLTYHSLEDRIVKHAFRKLCASDTPLDLPISPLPARYYLVHPGGLEPSPAEVERNPRARSARLRVLAVHKDAA